jgi:phenylalanyl-tRNA synthetase beta chain
MDFYDLKGLVEAMLDGLRILGAAYEPWKSPYFHPGKCARVVVNECQLGVLGELHPQVKAQYDLPSGPLLAAWFDLEALLETMPEGYAVESVPSFPPVLEDLAVVVDESVPADKVAEVIRGAAGKVVRNVRLFDLYRSEQLGRDKKSLAYSITYQASDRTLTDKDVAGIRQRILRRLEQELGAKLRA